MEYKVIKKGNIEQWFDQNNQSVKEICYYNNGQKSYEIYFLNDQYHREDGPARQWWYENGQKEFEAYYLNDQYHREDGPAIQWWYENGQKEYEEYWLNDQLHREDGPARQRWYENGQKDYETYYLNGIQVSKDHVIKETNKKINIKGKEFSEDTIYKALKDYLNF